MKRMVSLLISIGCALAGCYLRPIATNSPKSSEGVHVTLVGQECVDRMGSEGDPVSRSLAVKLKVDNPTTEQLRFETRRAELKVEEDIRIPIRESENVLVAPGDSREVELEYLHHSLCAQDFAIELDKALTVGGRPVEIAALHFSAQ